MSSIFFLTVPKIISEASLLLRPAPCSFWLASAAVSLIWSRLIISINHILCKKFALLSRVEERIVILKQNQRRKLQLKNFKEPRSKHAFSYCRKFYWFRATHMLLAPVNWALTVDSTPLLRIVACNEIYNFNLEVCFGESFQSRSFPYLRICSIMPFEAFQSNQLSGIMLLTVFIVNFSSLLTLLDSFAWYPNLLIICCVFRSARKWAVYKFGKRWGPQLNPSTTTFPRPSRRPAPQGAKMNIWWTTSS